MASLSSGALSSTIKLEPHLNNYSSSRHSDKGPTTLSLQRSSSVSTQLNGGFEPIRPLEFREALSMIHEGTHIEFFAYFPLLQECVANNSLSNTRIIHSHVIKTGTHQSLYVMACLVGVYGKCGDMVSARKVFDNLPIKNVIAWTTLMKGYAQNLEPVQVIALLKEMLQSGSFPSNHTLTIALNACSSLESFEMGKQFHGFMIKYKIDHDLFIGNALCRYYTKLGSLESALKTFKKIEEKDVVSWTSVIFACVENGASARGLEFFVEMLLEGVEPNEFTLNCVLSLCSMMLSLRVGLQVHALSIKLGYESNRWIMNSLLYLYLKCGSINEAQNLFSKIKDVNMVTWNATVAGHAQAMDIAKDAFSADHSGIKALGAYLMLNQSDMKPDQFTLSSILSVCGKLLALTQGEQIHAQTIKSGFLSDFVVGTALINMYNKCGSIKRASKAFLEMSTRSRISWTTMIASLAHNGRSQQALQHFEDMRITGVRPNEITFVAVLTACSHGGMVNEALEYFEMMQKDYKLKPVMDHYACLIDMFVRLGRLDDAFDIVKKIKCEPPALIWSLLVEGCMNQGNEELAFYAAEKLLKLRPKDIDTCIMLLNLYISAERCEDALRVRSLMKEEGLNEWSRISIRDKVYSFKTNENLHHPLNEDILTLLDELLEKAKGFGYKSDAKAEMAEDEEEKKTFSSGVYHSEKLAVAFGLLNTHANAAVRVVKNSTMCRDCHNFMKILSSLTSRKIVIQDRKRLHIFEDGQCACADSCSFLVEQGTQL